MNFFYISQGVLIGKTFKNKKVFFYFVFLYFYQKTLMETNSVHNHQGSRKDNTQSTVEPNKRTDSDSDSEEEGELCYICTEPITTFAISECDHRTCHRCSLRLRALYETRNCAYCKVRTFFFIITIFSN